MLSYLWKTVFIRLQSATFYRTSESWAEEVYQAGQDEPHPLSSVSVHQIRKETASNIPDE